MHKVSRTLLLAGVLAFGTLTAACGDKVNIVQPTVQTGVQSVTVTPQNATIAVNETIQLAASVTADASTAKTVTWTSSNSAVATVDGTGKVTGKAAGTVTILATSTADNTKQAAAAITVTAAAAPAPVVQPTVSINSVTDNNGNPVNLSNVQGQVNVTVNVSGGAGKIEVFLAPAANCSSNTIAANDVLVATQNSPSGTSAGPVTLSFNTAQLTSANAPQFPNGNYCVKARITTATGTATATNTAQLTLNNLNQFRGTLTFASQTGGPTSAISTNNGLNYNQGTLTVTVNPVIFTSNSAPAFISGYLSRNGEQAGGASPGNATFTNATVANGTATIVFPDTAGAAASRSIFQYTSLAAGDQLVITSATDASGNPIPLAGDFVVASGLRIDNDVPVLAAYTVNGGVAGYLGSSYSFSSGTTGTATDNRGGVPGVGGVTTQYYAGPAGSAAFATANSCTVTGLTPVSSATDLDNSTTNSAYRAKVVVSDRLGNKSCTDIATTFGVDKIAPTASLTAGTAANTAGTDAAANTGYNVSKNYTFVYSDTISGFNPTTPLIGTLVRNSFSSGAAADCVIGTYSAANRTCTATPAAGSNGNMAGQIEFTGGTGVVGYYTVSAQPVDQAGNRGNTVTRTAAFDNVAPALGALAQSPASVAPLGTVTVSGTATDNFNLISARGNLTYATAPNPFQGVTQSLGSFGGQTTSATASLALPTPVYLGLQNTGAGGAVNAGGAAPVASATVTDVGQNVSAASQRTITTTTARSDVSGNIQTFSGSASPSNPGSRVSSTTLTFSVGGTTAGLPNQPFAAVDVYQVINGELVLIGAQTLPSVTDDGAGNRTYRYSFTANNVPGGATTTYYGIGRDANGNAVISNAITVTNP